MNPAEQQEQDQDQARPRLRIIQDIWKNSLAAVLPDFGKLMYMASLRDPNSGVYRHYGLEKMYSEQESDDALREVHLELFLSWLRKPLVEQKEDLEHYFRTVDGDQALILENWRLLEPFRNCIPAGADEAGRELFLSDIGIIVDLMWLELFPSSLTTVA